MSAQVFYRKWRPQLFAEVAGQEYISRTLLNALASGRVAHAYLFCGPRGTGKTSMGRILAKALNCLTNGSGEPCGQCALCTAVTKGRAMDLIEVDAASNRGIDDIRSLREKVNYAPNESRYKVYIIDEVHMLSNDAFNALLKTLEEPPPHTVFVLATTEPHKLPATVISRCQRFDFRRISLSHASERLAHICQEEGVQAAPEVLAAIARASSGSLRDAENMLEQLVVGYGHELGFEQLREFLGLGGEEQVKDLTTAALKGDLAGGLAAIAQVANDGLDLHQFHRQLMQYLRGVLIQKAGGADTGDLPPEDLEGLREVAAATSMEHILQAVKMFGQVDQREASYSTLPLELALVETVSGPSETAQRAQPETAQEVRHAAQPPGSGRTEPAPPPPPPAAATTELRAPETPATTQPEAEADTQPEAEVGVPIPAGPTPDEGNAVPEEPPGSVGDQGSPEMLERLVTGWRSVIEALKGKGHKYKVDALLRSGEPVSADAETVVLGFPYQIFVDRMNEEMENPGTRRELEESVGGVLGGRRQIRCMVAAKQKRTGGHLMKAAVEMGAKVVEDGG